MLTIVPTTSSGLSASAYTLKIAGVNINLEAPKNISNARTISGGGVVSVVDGSIIGEERTFAAKLTETELETLQEIVAAADEWLIKTGGRIFTAALSLESSLKSRELKGYYDVSVQIVFTGELTGL